MPLQSSAVTPNPIRIHTARFRCRRSQFPPSNAERAVRRLAAYQRLIDTRRTDIDYPCVNAVADPAEDSPGGVWIHDGDGMGDPGHVITVSGGENPLINGGGDFFGGVLRYSLRDRAVVPRVQDPAVDLPVQDPVVDLPVQDPVVDLPVQDPVVDLPVQGQAVVLRVQGRVADRQSNHLLAAQEVVEAVVQEEEVVVVPYQNPQNMLAVAEVGEPRVEEEGVAAHREEEEGVARYNIHNSTADSSTTSHTERITAPYNMEDMVLTDTRTQDRIQVPLGQN